MSAAARRGGRLLRDEFDSRLAESGVQRHSFAKGFLQNALREAAGRTLYQLYKDTVAQWDGASMHCKREALAHVEHWMHYYRHLVTPVAFARHWKLSAVVSVVFTLRLQPVVGKCAIGWRRRHPRIPLYRTISWQLHSNKSHGNKLFVSPLMMHTACWEEFPHARYRTQTQRRSQFGYKSSSGGSNGAASLSNSGSIGAGFSSANNGGGSSRSGSRKK